MDGRTRTEESFDIDLRGGGGGGAGGVCIKAACLRGTREGGEREREGGSYAFAVHSLVLTHTTRRAIIEIRSGICMLQPASRPGGRAVGDSKVCGCVHAA